MFIGSVFYKDTKVWLFYQVKNIVYIDICDSGE